MLFVFMWQNKPQVAILSCKNNAHHHHQLLYVYVTQLKLV